jgi:hypothetical protein
VFLFDPKVPENIGTVTLSYTFFEVEGARLKAGVEEKARNVTNI